MKIYSTATQRLRLKKISSSLKGNAREEEVKPHLIKFFIYSMKNYRFPAFEQIKKTLNL